MSCLSSEPLAEWAGSWSFPPGVTYLNHGSFGPAPREVCQARREWLERLERDPMDLFVRALRPAMAAACDRLGRFVGCAGDDLVLVDNATYGMNIVAASARLAAGDEVLLTDHEYGAVERVWRRACESAGAQLVVAELPPPDESEDSLIAALLAAVTPRTRLAVVSHVTSPTALIFPIQRIATALRERGVSLCVDGPHAPAMVPLDLSRIDCDYYAASCHKWLSAPLGTGFLYVHPRLQLGIVPPVLSWGRAYPPDSAGHWTDEFTWLGTRDPTPLLTIPAAIDFLERVGLDVFRAHTHGLARYAASKLSAVLRSAPLASDDRWFGSMVALPLDARDHATLQDRLWQRHRLEIAVTTWRGQRLVRPSCHLYTGLADIDRLAAALEAELSFATPRCTA